VKTVEEPTELGIETTPLAIIRHIILTNAIDIGASLSNSKVTRHLPCDGTQAGISLLARNHLVPESFSCASPITLG